MYHESSILSHRPCIILRSVTSGAGMGCVVPDRHNAAPSYCLAEEGSLLPSIQCVAAPSHCTGA